LHISDRDIDEMLQLFARFNNSAPVELRFNFKKLSEDDKKILVAKVAKYLNISPENVRLFEKYKVVGDFVFLCEDPNCIKTKPRPLCTLDSFVLLKAFLELA